MEIQKYGTFNMSVGRPIDTLRFERMNCKQIAFQQVSTDGLTMPVQSIVKLNQDPHPDYFKALDALVPFSIKVLDLGPHWKFSSIGSLKLAWSYSNVTEKYTYKIENITIVRPSNVGELPIGRAINFGGITIDDIPWDVQALIDAIMDEAYLYCTGKKTAQLNLFDTPPQVSPELKKAGLELIQGAIRDALMAKGIKPYFIDGYLESAGDNPSVADFHEWEQGFDLEDGNPIAPPKRKRSKAKKVAA
jgi:hypothetical protein